MLIVNNVSTSPLNLVDNPYWLLQRTLNQTLCACFKIFDAAHVYCRKHCLSVGRVEAAETCCNPRQLSWGKKRGISNEILHCSTVHILFLLKLAYKHFRTISYSLWNSYHFTYTSATTCLQGFRFRCVSYYEKELCQVLASVRKFIACGNLTCFTVRKYINFYFVSF